MTKFNTLSKKMNPLQRIQNFFNNRSSGFRFLLIFLLLMVAFYLFYYSSFYTKYIDQLVVGTQASIGSVLLNLMGQGTSAIGSQISGSAFSMNVSGGCDGMEVMALLFASILASPVAWQYQWKGVLVGGGILAALNVLRLPILYLAGGYGSMELFDFLHVQGGFIIFVFISIFILIKWLAWANEKVKLDAPLQKEG